MACCTPRCRPLQLPDRCISIQPPRHPRQRQPLQAQFQSPRSCTSAPASRDLEQLTIIRSSGLPPEVVLRSAASLAASWPARGLEVLTPFAAACASGRARHHELYGPCGDGWYALPPWCLEIVRGGCGRGQDAQLSTWPQQPSEPSPSLRHRPRTHPTRPTPHPPLQPLLLPCQGL